MKRLVYKEIAQCLNGYGEVPEDIQDKRNDILDYIENNALPRGSGFDNGTKIAREIFKEKIVLSFEYHHMDAMGGYCGWTSHSVIIKPSLLFDLDMRITGKDGNGDKDYFYDVFNTVLMRELSDEDIDYIANIYRNGLK